METSLQIPEVFSGPNAIRNFLNPQNNPFTPMVELPESLNPFHKKNVHIFAKCEFLRPLMNIKALQVFGMIQSARDSGLLDEVNTLVENTSGNTGFSLAILAKVFGIKNVKLIVPWDTAPGKLEMLRLVGAQYEQSKSGGINRAKELGKQKSFFNLDQYGNEENPCAIEKYLAQQIWKQTQGELTVFCTGLGTTGTAIGVSNFLRKQKSKAVVVGVILTPDSAVPGVRSWKKLEEISFDWVKSIDHRLEVNTKESYKSSLTLIQQGILGGPSSGFALAGLKRFLQFKEKNNGLDGLRNDKGEVVCVFICPDTMFPYLDKYSTHLDSEDFDSGSFNPEI